MADGSRNPDEVVKSFSVEKSLGGRKRALIEDLLKQRKAAIAGFDEKMGILGYTFSLSCIPSTCTKCC